MIVLGLILIVIAVAAGALLFVATQPLTEPVELETPWVQASALPLALLIAGAAVMVLLWLGLVMIRGSIRRKTRRRRESKELERQAEREAQARRESEARREQDTRPVAAPVPATRSTDTSDRPGDRWDDDTPSGRHAAPAAAPSREETTGTGHREDNPSAEDSHSTGRGDTRVMDTRGDTGADTRADTRADTHAGSAADSPAEGARADASAEAPTRADHLMGRDKHESHP